MKIKKLLLISVPVESCNLTCEYCFLNAHQRAKKAEACFQYTPEHVGKCLSKERLGGRCIINLTGGGETLIPKEMPQYIYHLLLQGHYLEVVTNGTLTKRFDEIAAFPSELLSRLEFKFSFHYSELKKKKLLNIYFANVKKMWKCGCSFTIELMPNDKLEADIEDIITVCRQQLGAVCQITVGRNDATKNMELLTVHSEKKYKNIWSVFDSTMFNFKMDIFQKKIEDFCYAGAWTLYIDLGTGNAKQCYGQLINQNIFKYPNRPIKFEPVGRHCRQPYCYNGHALLTMGVVPGCQTPSYSDIRNRKCDDGKEWLSPTIKSAFSQKLYQNNREYSIFQKRKYEILYYFKFMKNVLCDWEEIYTKIIKKRKRRNFE